MRARSAQSRWPNSDFDIVKRVVVSLLNREGQPNLTVEKPNGDGRRIRVFWWGFRTGSNVTSQLPCAKSRTCGHVFGGQDFSVEEQDCVAVLSVKCETVPLSRVFGVGQGGIHEPDFL